ncbi:iron transporter [Kordiimonas sediminis]|uniref:Protein p34 n=2 Tax=Kordiimonas sediminis TaxID=1735581 RepID=A0A919EAT3_9PROT|nr:iron transporter [Kordiimonas sediminis]
MRWASRASVMVAVILISIKGVAWWLSGSVAMWGSLADSTLDLAASLVTLYAIKLALLPPDEDHRFGHGKAEALAGLFQASIMSGSAAYLALESIGRIWSPEPVSATNLVMVVSAVSIGLTLLLILFQSYVIRHTKSLAVSGDHLHYKGDLLLNAGVILAAFLAGAGYMLADGIIGLMIAAYILYGAYDIVVPAIHMLMDREFSDEEREQIFNIVMEGNGVLGVHDLKTRTSGRDKFIQMHLEVDGTITVHAGHLIADEAEAALSEVFPDAEILIHIDPPAPAEVSEDLTIREIAHIED